MKRPFFFCFLKFSLKHIRYHIDLNWQSLVKLNFKRLFKTL